MLYRVTAQAAEYPNITILWTRLLNVAVRWCGGMPTPDRAKKARTRIVMACNLESFHLQQRETVNLRNQSNELLTLPLPFHSAGL
jgi:hypothetical protein